VEDEEEERPRRGRPSPDRSSRAADADDEARDDEDAEDDSRSRSSRKPSSASRRRDTGGDDSELVASIFQRASAPNKEIGQILKETFAIYKANLPALAITALVIAVPGQFVAALVPSLLGMLFGLLPGALAIRLTVLVAIAASVVVMLVNQVAIAGATIGVADRVLGGEGGWRQYFARTLGQLPRLLSALLPFGLLVLAVGGLAFLVPALSFLSTIALFVGSFAFCFTPMIVLTEGVGGPAALKRSLAMVKGDLLRVFLVALICGIIAAVVAIVGGIVGAIPAAIIGGILGAINTSLGVYVGMLVSSIVAGLFAAAALPISAAGLSLVYFDIRRKKDRSPNQLRDELEELRG
jgi:hypothetical protein